MGLFMDYGFYTRTGGREEVVVEAGQVPASAVDLARSNFSRELKALRRSFRYNEYARIEQEMHPSGFFAKLGWAVGRGLVAIFTPLDVKLEEAGVLPKLRPSKQIEALMGEDAPRIVENRKKLASLKLSNKKVWDREHARRAAEKAAGKPEPGLAVNIPYLSVCVLLDYLFDNRPIQRFWFLETVARMPYFAYTSCLHLYESLGWWRAGAELRRVHNAEEWNELQHLLIMESLGGDKNWIDRFMAQHAAVIYYWILVAMYTLSPPTSYAFSELVEGHAVDTYAEFLDENEELLKSLPAPKVARDYYAGPDLYLFDSFQTSMPQRGTRRPKINNLYDVFVAIRDDEDEHIKTMVACKEGEVQESLSKQREELLKK
ncbi:unnamed protein product [Pedinophyceae sp. YPF-701]|nr:unnamed protein product [Pedinophyceae sp. YPF-701]